MRSGYFFEEGHIFTISKNNLTYITCIYCKWFLASFTLVHAGEQRGLAGLVASASGTSSPDALRRLTWSAGGMHPLVKSGRGPC